MAFKELMQDLFGAWRDRIKTPITGSFALAFILYNWRPILILLFSDESIEDKIIDIDKQHCGYWALLAPLIIALIYVVFVPYIMAGLEWLSKKAIIWRKQHKTELKKSDLKNNIEIAKEEFELEQIRSGQEGIKALRNEIEGLQNQVKDQNSRHKSQIEELNTQIETQNAQHKKQVENLNEQHKTKVENYEALIETYKNNNEGYRNAVRKLEAEIEILNKKLSTPSEVLDFKNVLDKLTPPEKKYFLSTSRLIPIRDIDIEGPGINKEYLNKLIRLNLLMINNYKKSIELTEFGEKFYQYIEEK